MYRPVKRSLVGNPISTALAHHERLDKKTALAVFFSYALSSVAHSTAAILCSITSGMRPGGRTGMTTVSLPESVPARWRQHLLHNQTSFLIKAELLFNPRVIVMGVPYHLRR
jgi:hypothetical protein